MRFRFLLFLSVVLLGIGQIWGQANLPFSFNGGRNDISSTTGLSHSGLGSDYSETNAKLKFDNKGDLLTLHFNGIADELSFTIRFNGSGSFGGTYEVVGSADGTNFDVSLFSLGAHTANLNVTYNVDNIPTNVKYIRWIYTEKSSGNIGLGNINLTGTATSCEDSNLTFANPTATADLVDGTFTQTASSLNETTAITYESSDELVATVNATTGEVTLVGLGTTTITANQEAGTHNATEYCAGTATYELTVISTEPVLTVSTNSLSFTAFAGGASATETITVEGNNLTGNIALALSGDANFSITPTSLSSTGGEVTITYTPSATPATHSATLTVSNGSLSEVIALSGTTNEVPEIDCFEEDFSDITNGNSTSSTGSSSQWNGNDNFPTVDRAYQAGGAVRLGTSSNMGSITSVPLTDYVGQNVTVSFSSKAWATASTSIKVSFGTQSQVVNLPAASNWTDGLSDYEVVFENIEPNATLTFESNSTSERRFFIDNISVCIDGPSIPTPQITVTPSGDHDFGNQLVGSTSTPETFTITNTGNADLTIGTIALSGANADQFSVTQAESSTVTQGNTTTFTVSFSPTSLGSKTATVTIPNNDEDYTFTVTGTGSYAAASDIATNTSYPYKENILYANYQTPTITNTSNSVGVFQFAVRDGGGDNDGDDKPTTLTDISFNYTGTANTIRAAALFDENAHIANGVVTANGISFSGLNIVAPDNDSSPNITLRVSFTETVTDKEKLVFTVASATADASGSVFAQANAGGAFSDNNNTSNKNRIEVVADRLAFAQQPTTTSINTAMSPAVTVSANDIFGNRDLDFTGTISISSYGVLTGDPVTQSAISGLATFSNLIHTVAETGIMLKASYSTWSIESNEFDITEIVYANGDYRTTGSGNWVSNSPTPAIWEQFNGTTWTTSNSPSYNTSNNVYIRNGHTITTGGGFGSSVKLKIMEGGVFNANHPSTTASIHVYEGGTLNIAASITNNGDFIIEDNGTVNLNGGGDNYSTLWAGTEKFAANSNFNVNYANIDNTLFANNKVSVNSSTNALFGNLTIQPTTFNKESGNWTGMFPNGIYQLTANDFTVNNSTGRNFTFNGGDFTVGGNFIVNVTSTGEVATRSNSGEQTMTVQGNVVKNGSGRFRMNGQGIFTLNIDGNLQVNDGNFRLGVSNSGSVYTHVNLKGNVIATTNGFIDSNSSTTNTNFNFTGTGDGLTIETTQTIDIASTSTGANKNILFNIKEGAYVRLINRNFELGQYSRLTVEGGGTLDFGFNGSTALNVAGFGKTGTGFTSEAGSYLKITSPQGIVSTSGSVGNIQTNTAPVINTLGTFHYIGKEDQVTGNGIGTSSSGRAVIVDMESDALVLTPSVSFGITNNANPHINNNNGGILDIRKGRFVETETEYVTGSTGSLKMEEGTYYEVVKATEGTSDYIPRISGTYELNGGEINLASTGDQTLRGGKSYFDLTFSNGAIKTVSNNSTPDIEGLVYIAESTTLDVSGRTNNGFGKSVTDLLMDTNSKFIVDGAEVRPQLGGDYVLDLTSEIEFTGSSATKIRVAPEYAKVVVSGTNVTAGSTDVAGLTFQNGGSFTVKDGATFKVNNPDGFTGSTTASIKNAEDLAAITLEPNSTIEYNGSEAQTITNGIVTTPSDAHYENLRISGSGVKTTALGNLIVNNITYVDAATLRVAETNDDVAPNVLTARKGIQVASGATALFENNANLMQDDGAVNIGDITVERFVQDMNNVLPNHMDYVYWSSPVTGQGIHNGTNSIFSPGTPINRNYEYHEPTDYFVPTPDETFIPGKGYAIRAETGPNFENGYDKTYTFTGIPNNGLVSIPIQKSPDYPDGVEHGYNLVGNPYPSNIDADVLFDLNESQIEPIIYLWTNNITQPYQPGSSYNGESYATYNRVGGVSAGEQAEPAGSGWSMNEEPDGIIKVGQGFIIKAREDADTLRFQNMVGTTPLRITDKGYFFQKNLSQKDRFWLEQKSPLGMINSTLVGYVLGATNEFEKDYDAPMLTETSDAIYTVIDSIKLRIQGRSFPLELTDVVPLGLNHFEAGVYTIGIRKVDGIFNQQSIYLRDKQKEIVHNLSLDGEYVYEANAGELTDRFEIIFQEDEVMSTSDLLDNSIKIYHTDQNIVIESEKEKILSVEVYDLNGRKVHSKDRINSNLYQIQKTSLATQVFVVKVLTDGGKVETRKIINQ